MQTTLDVMVPYKPRLAVITYKPGLYKQELLPHVPVLNCRITCNVTFEILEAIYLKFLSIAFYKVN